MACPLRACAGGRYPTLGLLACWFRLRLLVVTPGWEANDLPPLT